MVKTNKCTRHKGSYSTLRKCDKKGLKKLVNNQDKQTKEGSKDEKEKEERRNDCEIR